MYLPCYKLVTRSRRNHDWIWQKEPVINLEQLPPKQDILENYTEIPINKKQTYYMYFYKKYRDKRDINFTFSTTTFCFKSLYNLL